MATQTTMQQFLSRFPLAVKFEQVSTRPNQDEWDKEARHYNYMLTLGTRTMAGTYSMGSGLSREPRLEDILESLSMDIEGLNSITFEQWAEDCGYNPDSRRAFGIWEAICQEDLQLLTLLGEDGYEAFKSAHLYDTE